MGRPNRMIFSYSFAEDGSCVARSPAAPRGLGSDGPKCKTSTRNRFGRPPANVDHQYPEAISHPAIALLLRRANWHRLGA
jgi:hypothetical protein